MERQFAALDSLQAELRAGELPSLQVVAVLKQDARSRVDTMVGARRLPVLYDGSSRVFEKIYGASKKRAFFLYDAEGCLIAGGVEGDPDKRADRATIRQRLLDTYGPR
ncbi:MAG: hypothetical protein FJY75_08610 [Candidatus Eisenbacteria bacterium]|uniref:Uncharacterized protein n=1 Tax=Eiseniibacteriota bacterium TaxID=2212470 RepID=A0A937XBJ6_UNCEI|nr:hypothetical protein [Candidatus Eisenbacteria bacterium]